MYGDTSSNNIFAEEYLNMFFCKNKLKFMKEGYNYDKEKNTEYAKTHRVYKNQLNKENKLIDNKKEKEKQ